MKFLLWVQVMSTMSALNIFYNFYMRLNSTVSSAYYRLDQKN